MPVAPDLCGSALDGRYELHAVIGEGAFGRVYRGFDRRLARAVAVKVIKPWWAEDPEWVGSFEREAQLLARVSDPAIVQIFDVGHAEEGLYYVSELIDGESLQRRLKRGPIAPWDAAALAEQLCRGLAQAHGQRIIHRDVKPANILISSAGRVKVGDFGVARLAEGSSDGALATVVGTPRYMAPEQGSGKTTSPATDVYSAGVVLYEMLAGAPPFTGTSMVELALAHLQTPPPPLPSATPPQLAEIVMRALAKAPGDRYADAGEMARALTAVRQSAPPRQRSVQPRPAVAIGGHGQDVTRLGPPLTPRRRWNPAARRRTVASFTLVLAVLAALVIGAVLLSHRSARVPRLVGLTRSQLAAAARRADLRLQTETSYSAIVPAGTALAQRPGAHRSVARNSTVTVTVSRGPAPIRVPYVLHDTTSDAQQSLNRAGLQSTLEPGPDPGATPGTVYGESPPAESDIPPGSTVTLHTAEIPKWQPAQATFSANAAAESPSFTIRGPLWRIVYSMHYEGICEFVFFCGAPTAHVYRITSGATVTSFSLSTGDDQTRTIRSGPGTYRVQIIPGRDTAGFTVAAEDYF